MFTAKEATARYQPRPGDAPHDLFQSRLTVCQACPLRRAQTCSLADQLVTILARPAKTICPNRSWPGDPVAAPVGAPLPPTALGHRSGSAEADVVVVCHNYGCFLKEALDSVLSQTLRPAAVIVIDAGSTDDTAAVAETFRDRGVELVRTESANPHDAQRAGFAAAAHPFLCFLDADDVLPPDYLQAGLPLFADPRVAIVYSDMQKFGDETGRLTFPNPGDVVIDQQNRCHAGSLLRRAAVEISGAFDAGVRLPAGGLQDWFLFRKIAAHGWHLAKSPALYGYRRHSASFMARAGRARASYFELGALAAETLTLFVPLSGRDWAWPTLRNFLSCQRWPHDQVRLVLCDTSQSPEFSDMIRDWVATCDYADVRYYRQAAGLPGLADADRKTDLDIRRAVQAAMPRIYNRLAREATTEYVWILEDDILPPLDAAERLLRGFDDVTASVSGAYFSRYRDGLVAWGSAYQILDAGDIPLAAAGELPPAVGGNGFGCVMLRRSVLRQTVLQHAAPSGDYDPNFYHWLAGTRMKARLDRSILCDHRSPAEPGQ